MISTVKEFLTVQVTRRTIMPPETKSTKLLGFNGSEAQVTEDGIYRVRVFMRPLLAAMIDALDEVESLEEDNDATRD